MRVEVIPQLGIGDSQRKRTGDVLNTLIADSSCRLFRFAVAYMRTSGWYRLSGSVESLLNRGGGVAGAVGIDDGITTVEALEALCQISSRSTIFHTVSGFIYHPKLYVAGGEGYAVVIVGSPNLTRDGLFRNVELATAVHLDFESENDLEVYQKYDAFVSELLDAANPNVQRVTNHNLRALVNAGAIGHESRVKEPGPTLRPRRATPRSTVLDDLFPPMRVPVAPPASVAVAQPPSARPPVIVPPVASGTDAMFMMQLSRFDSSHRTGVGGTPEVLVPHPAAGFFPQLSSSGRRYPDVYFDVSLNTPTGRERHGFRFWYYEERATGTRIDEYRLRMDRDTIDLTDPEGGDMLIINKLAAGSDPAYEVTILPSTDPTFPAFLDRCDRRVQDKSWGIV